MKRTIFIWIIVAILAIIFLFVVLRRVGLIKSRVAKETEKKTDKIKQEKKTVKDTINKSEYFKPDFHNKFNVSVLLPEATAINLADDIHNAFGMFNDDEEAIYRVFRILTNKAQVSQLADIYQNNYKSDLVGDLIDSMSDGEMQIIFQITDKL